MRDILDYTEKYNQYSFETYQVKYRRKKVIEEIEKYKPSSILEIGCADNPLFLDVLGVDFTIVEPSTLFSSNAIELSKKYKRNVKVICDFFENTIDNHNRYDMIICSALLHEIENPHDFLLSLFSICDTDTIIHINVPNANSMHRILALESGLISNIYDMHKRNIELQQNSVFDIKTLSNLIYSAGGSVIDSGTFFIKPFSHAQMLSLLNNEIITENVLDGFYNMSSYMPNLGSELYVTCKKCV